MDERIRAWKEAFELVEPIIEQHGLEKYNVGATTIFVPQPSTMTAVDQHVDHVMRVANWLMGKDD